ncbi:MAG: glycoside hydrolase family 88 protein [Melioribacteraceae bacterium]|nr:glycoside hydrolase family 88 protein [Melioribacteraceae bacterium]
MKKIILLIFLTLTSVSINDSNAGNLLPAQLDVIINQVKEQLLEKYDIFNSRYPDYTVNGKWNYRSKINWLSGFIGGELWNIYDVTGDEIFKLKALSVADALIDYSYIDYTHDMGFIFLPSVVKAYQITGEKKYKDAALNAVRMLAARFNKNGNYIRAWGKLGSEDKAGLMIIDTMMNLELLFWAAAEFGIPEFYEIAYKHAVICMNEHVRSDFSSHHVVEFDPSTGNVIKKFTHQGYSDESVWARGQAWGIYGFSIAYKYTSDERFLNVAQKMAEYFIYHLPDDLVPHWDLNLSGESNPKDASAAVIAASGMEMLAGLSETREQFKLYKSYFTKISESILDGYMFYNSERNIEEGLLIHTVYNYHKDWGVDESFPCGDYYLTEVISKYYNYLNEAAIDRKALRNRVCINDNWFYLEDNIKDYNKLHLTKHKWELVDLPHTWNAFDAVDQQPGYRRGISWYMKELLLRNIDYNLKYLLEFESINLKSEIYINGNFAGSHSGGYIGFDIDITDFITEGINTITVKADNSIDPRLIPSQKSDFFIYGGISRDVYLKSIPATSIKNLKISTPVVNEKSADTHVLFELDDLNFAHGEVFLELIDPTGLQKIELRREINPDQKEKQFGFALPKIENPQLWSTSQPNLYKLRLSLYNETGMLDQVEEKFGYRWFEFKEYGAFYLNGKQLLLRGTHRHEEHAGMGNAMPNELHRKDLEMIKEMGANFVRLAHYPQDPEVYKTCDELGILVWDELPWCRGGVGDDIWKSNTKRLLKEMIDQNYNHPSIIIWSLGNEIYWLPDFENGDDIDSLRTFVELLDNYTHELDPYRLTAIRKFYEGSDLVDVFSPSIWAGWYSGVYKSYSNAINDAVQKYKRFFHAEYGGSSHKGRHTESPITGDGYLNPDEWAEEINQVKVKNVAQIGDWSESYIVDLFDWHLRISESYEKFTGNAQWAFKDFGTPLRPENALPYINQKGLVDREGNPKDAYYVFKSYWSNNPKFCYIESHSWTDRTGKPGEMNEVNVFSNCDKVELFVNGLSQGIKTRDKKEYPAQGLSWDVVFIEGKNIIVAESVHDHDAAEDSISIDYFTQPNRKPDKILLSSEKLINGNYLIKAVMSDVNGRRCLDYNSRVYFSISGNGKLLENYGTYSGSSVIEFANGLAEIEFKPVPFEETIIEARNQDFKGSYIKIIY